MKKAWKPLHPCDVSLPSSSVFNERDNQRVEEWRGTPAPETIQLCLLGDKSCLLKVSVPEFALALTRFISAAGVFLQGWKSQVRPEYKEWVKQMTKIQSSELLKLNLHNCKKSYLLVRNQFLFFIRHYAFKEFTYVLDVHLMF